MTKNSVAQAYGPELVINGSVDGDGAPWIAQGESTITGACRIYSSAGSFSQISQLDVMEAGKEYLISYTVVSTDGATITDSAGGVTWDTSSTGYKSQTLIIDTPSLVFKRLGGVTDVTLDDISVKEIL